MNVDRLTPGEVIAALERHLDEASKGDVIHLPGVRQGWNGARPACGVRGVMSLMWLGAVSTEIASTDLSGAEQLDVTCRRCMQAMRRVGFPVIWQRWHFWLVADLAERTPEAATGCTYSARV